MTRNDGSDERYDRLDRSYEAYPNVEDHPLNRETAFGVNHHGDWEEQKMNVITCLADIRDVYDDHVVVVGGDKNGRGGPTKHYLIDHEPDEGEYGEYVLTRSGKHSDRERFSEAGKLVRRLDELWPKGSFTYVALLHRSQSEFIADVIDDMCQRKPPGRILIAA